MDKKRTPIRTILAAVAGFLVGCACACFILLILSERTNLLTCIDIFSGHVPPSATRRFIDQVVEATLSEDYEWLATVSEPDALVDLRINNPRITREYEIVLSDNLAGLYEYKLQFDNGELVYVTLWGEWPQCPDFNVTDEEIFQYLRISSFEEVVR